MQASTSSRQATWIVLLALSPLAYVGSIWLETKRPARSVVGSFTREQAVEATRRFAATRQMDTTGWRADAGVNKDDKNKDLALILEHERLPDLDRLTTPVPISVLLRGPRPDQWLRTTISTTGRVVSFQQNDPPAGVPQLSEAAGRDVARAFVAERLGADIVAVLENEKVNATGKLMQHREFTWEARLPWLQHAKTIVYVTVAGDRVIAQGSSVSFDAAYMNRYRPYHGWITGLQVAAWLYVAILGLYALLRYIRRSYDKEVSHLRTIVIALLFAGVTFAVLFADPGMLMAAQKGRPEGGAFLVVIGVFLALGTAFIGGFMGVAYGAGEGALRESFPGKLTSLDALLAGKLFSSNVAQSVLIGGAVAGWMTLLHSGALLAVRSVRSGADVAVLTSGIIPLPLLNVMLDVMSDALVVMSFGVLLPLALLRRRIRNERVFYPILGVACLVCAAGPAAGGTWQVFALSLMALTAAAMLPFLLGDLLAAAAAIFAFEFFGVLVQRSLVSEHWLNLTLKVAAAGLIFLAAQVYFARYGRTYKEWEIRPRYARYVAEHLAMQADISAARQAQLRLLPDAPPRITGVTIAGSCIPSKEVSGDFYDFYALDERRVGVFLADGVTGQLGSAMTIALAKGYLLYTTRLDIGPAEILRRVAGVLQTFAHAGSMQISMLYAVVDTSARTVRFARTGDMPRLLINGNEPPQEWEQASADRMALRHGLSTLAPNDALIFYTRGFEAQIARQRRQPAGRFVAKTVSDIRSGSAADLHAAMMEAAIRRKHEQPPDDVTAVVIRLDKQSDRAMEVVA